MDGIARRTEKDIVAMLRKMYPQGTLVEAIKVNYIPKGMRGVVREVKNNGDISVIWENEDITSVEFGNESIRSVVDGMCLLNMKMGSCGAAACKECGWNEVVHKERVFRIRHGGMKKNKEGIRTLHVKKTFKP